VFIVIGAQVGGKLINRVGTTTVVRLGLCAYLLGLFFILHVVGLGVTEWTLLPGLAFYGIGIGFAGAQLTNVVLSDIPKDSSGVASGANTTVRQVGAALGVAVIGSLLAVQTANQAIARIGRTALAPAVKAHAVAGVHTFGTSYAPAVGTTPHDSAVLQHLFETSIASATRYAMVFAIVVVGIGTLLSFLIPHIPAPVEREVDILEPVEPLDVDPSLVGDVL
jgi:hypothetical protein